MSDPLEDILKKAVGEMNFLPKFDPAPVSPFAKQGFRSSTIKVHYDAYESDAKQAAFMAEHRERVTDTQKRLHADPQSVVEELYNFVLDHPEIPVIRNHLFIALKYAGYDDEAAAVCVETYFRFPKYVFGFTNYLTLLDTFGRWREADQLLQHINGVQDIDPARTEYHASEVYAFESTMCLYLLSREQFEAAASRLEVAASLVSKDDPRLISLLYEFEQRVGSFAKQSKKPSKSKKASKGKKKK